MAVNYTDVQKTEKYISRTNFDALEMAAVPEGTEFNIVDQIHESDLDSDVLQKLNNNAKINTANTFTAAQTFKKDITIEGNIFQNGSAYETHAEKLYTKNDMIYTRDGATSALADNAYTGIQAVKYDGTNDGQLVFGKDGVARVGDVGNTQPLATRAEKGALTDGHLLQWDAAGQTLIDSGKSVSDLEGGGGDVTAAGNNTFTGSNTFTNDTNFKSNISIYDIMNPDTLTATLTTKIDNTGATRLPLMEVSYEFQPSHNGKYPLFDFYQYGGGAENSIGVTNFKDGNIAGGDDMFKSVVISSRGQIRYVEYDTHNGNNEKLITSYNLPHRDASGVYTLATTDDISNASYFNNEILFMSPVQFTQGIKDSDSGSIITLPGKGGTFALTKDLPEANPTAEGTVALTKLKVGDVVYTISNGGGSGDVTAAGNNYFSGENTFTKKVIFSSLTESADFVGKPSFKAGIEITAGAVTSGGKTFSLPNKSGVFAITDDIPISSATLSDNDTTLTLVLK